MLCITLTTLLLISSFNLSFSTEVCNPHDKKALLQIKKQFGNPPSLSSWNISTDCCTNWQNSIDASVHCDDHGRVTRINLNGNGRPDFSGEFPAAFGHLSFLEFLVIFDIPYVTGSIPHTFAKLTNLRVLVIGISSLSGPIPHFLGRLTNMKQLDLISSNLTGPIPNTLAQLTNLTELSLGGNQLSGPIPDIFGLMSRLSNIDLSHNNLRGPIPASLGLLPNIGYISLQHNQLTGPIPESLGLLKNPVDIIMSHNQLTGPIPKSLGRISAQQLDLSFNNITGDALVLFSNSTNRTTSFGISYIYLNNNFLKFYFSNVELRKDIYGFNISHNMIYGSLPQSLANVPYLFEMDVSYNCLCGPIPTSRRLQQFGLDVYAHNKCLCGPPLPAC